MLLPGSGLAQSDRQDFSRKVSQRPQSYEALSFQINRVFCAFSYRKSGFSNFRVSGAFFLYLSGKERPQKGKPFVNHGRCREGPATRGDWNQGQKRYPKETCATKLQVNFLVRFASCKTLVLLGSTLAHQNRTIAIASDFRIDGAKSPEILQKEGVLG